MTVVVLIFFSVGCTFPNRGLGDFGDAPDGGPTHYLFGVTTGLFPSLLASNGAWAEDTTTVWLGKQVDTEDDSEQGDADKYDDGVVVDLRPCAISYVAVVVHIPDPGTTTGTGYLNLFFDWDKNGRWGGSDDCASEWALENFPIDLAQQQTETKIYGLQLPAGELAEDIWYRATISLDQPLSAEDGSGAIASGEVEDYGPKLTVPTDIPKDGIFAAECSPQVLKIQHGQKGTLKVTEHKGSEPITEVELADNVDPKNKERVIEKTSANEFSYESIQQHNLNQIIEEKISLRVRFGPQASVLIDCPVWVIHKESVIIDEGEEDKSNANTNTGSGNKTTNTKDVNKDTIVNSEDEQLEPINVNLSLPEDSPTTAEESTDTAEDEVPVYAPFAAACSPDSVHIRHGQTIKLLIKPLANTDPLASIINIDILDQDYTNEKPEEAAALRQMRTLGEPTKNPDGSWTIEYTSNHIHGPKHLETDWVSFKVDTILGHEDFKSCTIWIEHENPGEPPAPLPEKSEDSASSGTYGIECKQNRLLMSHGQTAKFWIVDSKDATIESKEVDFHPDVLQYTPEYKAKHPDYKGDNDVEFTTDDKGYIYIRSTNVHPVENFPLELFSFTVRGYYDDPTMESETECDLMIVHAEGNPLDILLGGELVLEEDFVKEDTNQEDQDLVYYDAECVPPVARIKHGESVIFTIKKTAVGPDEPKIIELDPYYKRFTPELMSKYYSKTNPSAGELTLIPPNQIKFRSLEVHESEDTIFYFDVRAYYEDESVEVPVSCFASIEHDEPTTVTESPEDETSSIDEIFDAHYEKDVTNEYGQVITALTLKIKIIDEAVAQTVSGFEVKLPTQSTALPNAYESNININEYGYYKSNWECGLSDGNTTVRCQGSEPLRSDKYSLMSFYFQRDISALPENLTINLLKNDGSPVLVASVPFQEKID